jgi:hypothetical protein
MQRLLNVATLLSAALILTILFSLRRAHIRVEYSVSWLLAGLVVLVLSRWETALHWLGALMGISYPPAVLLSITIGVFLLVLYRISMIISALKDNNIALAQKLAILEFQLNAIREGREQAAGS